MHTTEFLSIVHPLIIIVTNLVNDHNLAHPEDIRYGGYFCLRERGRKTPIGIAQICDIPDDEKAAKYLRVSQGKAMAFWENPSLISTYEIRNPDTEMWGGGIQAGKYEPGFSGLTEHEDELALIQLAHLKKWQTIEELQEIATISKNAQASEFLYHAEMLRRSRSTTHKSQGR